MLKSNRTTCLFFFVDFPVGWQEKKEMCNFKLPHLHWCHRFIERWREFCWKAEVLRKHQSFIHWFKSSIQNVFYSNVWFLIILLRSNLMGTKFTVFDNALNPERALPDMSNARQELAGIIYVSCYTAHYKRSTLNFKHTVLRFKSGNIFLKNIFDLFVSSGNKCLRHERTQKDDHCHSRNGQG